MINVGIVGSTGYGGCELVRFLLTHPNVHIEWVSSRTYSDQEYSDVYKGYFTLLDQKCIDENLEKYLDNVEITAVDISEKSLDVAKTNAKNNEVENKITFIESNLFENIVNEKYDIIVSNPPYIRKDVIKTLTKEVQKEPKIALDGGYDGLDFYRKITHQSEEYLKFNGYLCFEIGYDQKKDVIKIINDEKKFTGTYSKKDLCDNDRIIVTRLD